MSLNIDLLNLALFSLLDRVLYTPERLEKIAEEAAKQNSPFSLNDRLGLIHDAMALSKAGLAKLSSAMTLVDKLKHEKECEPRLSVIHSMLELL